MEEDQQQPVFPPELFEAIINSLAERPSSVTLTQEQSTNLNACSLVCRMFLSLARAHLFRLVMFSLHGDGLNRLINLLENVPNVGNYIQELSIKGNTYNWLGIPDKDLKRATDLLLGLSAVNSVAVCGCSQYGIINRASTHDSVSPFCNLLINTYARRGTLRTFSVKKVVELPFTTLFSSNSMNVLSLDRCYLPPLTEPITTIKSLALRKMPLAVSLLSYFPNLEELSIIRADIKEPSKSANQASIPSFQIKSLTLDQCSESGGSDAETASMTTFLDYFFNEAEKKDVKPFRHLKSFRVVHRSHSGLSAIAPLLKETAATIQSFSFAGKWQREISRSSGCLTYLNIFCVGITPLVFPPPVIPTVEVIKHLLDSQHVISLRCGSLKDVKLVSTINVSVLNILPVVTSFYPTAPLQQALKHPHFDSISTTGGKNDTLESWSDFISSVSDNVLGFAGIKEVELYALIDGNDAPVIHEDNEIPDSIVNKVVTGKGIFLGTSFDGYDRTQWSKAKVAFCI